jgi:hypothetical protein
VRCVLLLAFFMPSLKRGTTPEAIEKPIPRLSLGRLLPLQAFPHAAPVPTAYANDQEFHPKFSGF